MITCLLEQWPGPFQCVSGNSAIIFILLFMVCHLKYLLGRLKIEWLFPQTSLCFHLGNSNISLSACFKFNWSQHGFALASHLLVSSLCTKVNELINVPASGKGDTKTLKANCIWICFQMPHAQAFPPVDQSSWGHLRLHDGWHQDMGTGGTDQDFFLPAVPPPSSPTQLPERFPQTNLQPKWLKFPLKPNTGSPSLDMPETPPLWHQVTSNKNYFIIYKI